MAHGGVVAHTSSWTPAAYELEESPPPSDFRIGGLSELADGSREQKDKVVYVLMGLTAGKPPGTGAVQKYWNRGLPLIASRHCVSFLPVSVPRRIVVRDVAASLGLAVAAAAIPCQPLSRRVDKRSDYWLSPRDVPCQSSSSFRVWSQ